MAGTTIATREPERLDVKQLEYIANTSFMPANYRGKLPEILACVATGREMGLGDMESLRSIYIVDGKPTMGAELMVRLARRAGHRVTWEYAQDGSRCTVAGARGDSSDTGVFTYTLEMAKRAGLLSKKNWQQYPEAMLFARAASQLCRMLFQDVLGGVSYAKEELDEVGPSARDMTLEQAPPLPKEEDGAGTPSAPAGKVITGGDASSSESGETESLFVPPPSVRNHETGE